MVLTTRPERRVFFAPLLACTVLAAWILVPVATAQTAGPSSRSERRLWQSSEHEVAQLEQSGLLYSDSALTAYVTALAARVAPPPAASPGAPVPIRVYIVLDPEANAFALPTGQVYVHAGLLTLLDREDQLAHILGHEIAHVTERHSAERLDNARSISSAVQILGLAASIGFGVGGGSGFWGGLSNLGLTLTGTLAIRGHGRAAEAEADQLALVALGRAGFDVCAAPEAFAHLLERYPDRRGAETFFYADHPRLLDRREAATEAAERARGSACTPAPPSPAYLDQTAPLRAHLVELWVRAGRFDQAVADADRFLAADSARAVLWAWRAEALRRADPTPERLAIAADDARHALALDPAVAVAHRTLGAIAEAQGDAHAARAAYTAYLDARPDAPDRRYVRGRLTALDAPTP